MNGDTCAWCGDAIREGDALAPVYGAPMHWECGLRSVAGGLNHQMGRCSCCGGTEPPDPPELTRHEAALAAAAYFRRHEAQHD